LAKLAYPHGGLCAISETFADIIHEYDGEVKLNKSGSSILIDKGKAVGGKLKSGCGTGCRWCPVSRRCATSHLMRVHRAKALRKSGILTFQPLVFLLCE